MHLDVVDLRAFYYRSRLGRAAQRAIRARIRALWPDTRGANVAGFGFAVPLLRPYLPEAARVLALMPAEQGVMPWPPDDDNVSVMVDEHYWPLAAKSVDRLIVMHGLETSERPGALLEECARVLDTDGRALFVVPHRAGLWARRDRTPFGFGRPYSLSQLHTQLRRYGLKPVRHRAALFAPPSEKRFWLRSAPLWERIGQRLSSRFAGGVLMVEATKPVDIPSGSSVKERERRPARVLEGLPKPAADPA